MPCTSGQRSAAKLLLSNYRDRRWADLTLVFRGKEYLVHRAVLCPRSTVLDTMCRGQWKEASSRKIEVFASDQANLERFLAWAYTGEYDSPLTDKHEAPPKTRRKKIEWAEEDGEWNPVTGMVEFPPSGSETDESDFVPVLIGEKRKRHPYNLPSSDDNEDESDYEETINSTKRTSKKTKITREADKSLTPASASASESRKQRELRRSSAVTPRPSATPTKDDKSDTAADDIKTHPTPTPVNEAVLSTAHFATNDSAPPPTPVADRDRFNRAIIVEAAMLKLADYYSVAELLTFVRSSLSKISALWSRVTSAKDFAATIEEATADLPHQEHAIWDQLLELAVERAGELLEEPSFRAALLREENAFLAECFVKGLVRRYELLVIENEKHRRKFSVRAGYRSSIWRRVEEEEGRVYETIKKVEEITEKSSGVRPKVRRMELSKQRKAMADEGNFEVDGPGEGKTQMHRVLRHR